MICPICKKDTDWSRIIYREDRLWTIKIYLLHCGHQKEEKEPND